MNSRLLLTALGAALVLSACSKTKTEEEPEATATATAPSVEEAAGPSAAPEPTETQATPEVTQSASPSTTEAVASNQIPAAIRGRWGLVPKDCTSKLGDAKGLLTVSAGQLKFYESVARLGKVKEADETRIRATFSYSGEGQTWTQDVVLDAQDGGKTLIRRDYGPDALPGPLKYTRCS